jgi:hypothetical protein
MSAVWCGMVARCCGRRMGIGGGDRGDGGTLGVWVGGWDEGMGRLRG